MSYIFWDGNMITFATHFYLHSVNKFPCKVKRRAIKLKPNIAYNTLHAIWTDVKTVAPFDMQVSSYFIMYTAEYNSLSVLLYRLKLWRQDTSIIWHWFEFSYKKWSMLIIISYLHTQKKTTPCSNTKYLLFGKGLVKEKLWDNLEEKKQQLCKTQITQLCW